MNHFVLIGLITLLISGATWAQAPQSAQAPQTAGAPAADTDNTADANAEMLALEDQIREGKRAFIEQQMELTPAEAAKFWPVYDSHQEALSKLNQRRLDNILAYAKAWNAGVIDDATAASLAKAALSIEKDEAAQMQSTFDKAKRVVSASKALRYLQVEGKVRAIVRFEQAADVPFAH